MDAILTGTTTSGQSWLESNGNGGVLHFSQRSRTEASALDGLVYIQDTRCGDLCKDAVGVFYSSSQLSW